MFALELVVSIAIIAAFILYQILQSRPAPKPKLTIPPPQPESPKPPAPVVSKPKTNLTPDPPKSSQSNLPAVKILFGSQTGTAEELCNRLSEEAKENSFAPEVVDLDDYDCESLKNESLVIFGLATYGEGDPTDNARRFNDWLMSEQRPADLLKGVNFTVFGLGNKTYEQFNATARRFDQRLEELGAKRVYPRGEGDDDGSLEDDFRKWKKNLWTTLCKLYSLNKPETDNQPESLKRRYKIVIHQDSHATQDPLTDRSALNKSQHGLMGYDMKLPVKGHILVNKDLHSVDSDRVCRHIEVDVHDLKYEAGDHLGVFAPNDQELVNSMAKRLGVSLDTRFTLEALHSDGKIGPFTLQQALSQYYDLTSSPSKAAIEVLAYYASDPKEQHELMLLVENEEKYKTYVTENSRILLEVLTEFPSVKIPLDHALELLHRLLPRFYSISSSSKSHPGVAHITMVTVDYLTPTGRRHKGVATTWLANQNPSSEIDIFVRHSTFKLPQELSTPVIMVGPGTGLAPFRGFIQDRIIQASQLPVEQRPPTEYNTLFFGCRHKDKDFIYKDELLSWAENKSIELHLAFSRDQEKKVYVQHKMAENALSIWNLLEKGAYFYICGDAKSMAKDVHAQLIALVSLHGKKDEKEAHLFVEHLQKEKRYLTDIWA